TMEGGRGFHSFNGGQAIPQAVYWNGWSHAVEFVVVRKQSPTLTLPNEGRVRTCRDLVQTLPPHGNSRQANQQKPASQKQSDRELRSAPRLRQLPGGGGWRRRRRGCGRRRSCRHLPCHAVRQRSVAVD